MQKLNLLIILLLIGIPAFSQNQILLSSGGQLEKFGHLLIDYSLGETVISTEQTSNNLLISQGFLQHFNTPKNTLDINGGISVSPVPAKSFIKLMQFKNLTNGTIYTIYDAKGQKVLSAPMTSNPSKIYLNNFNKGLYIIRVSDKKSGLTGIKKFTIN